MSGTESPDFDRSAESFQVLDEARQDREEIKRLNAWVSDLQSGMYVNCVYCGHRYGPGETTPVTMADALKAHVAQCPKHPMSRLLKAAEGFRVAMIDSGATGELPQDRYIDQLRELEGAIFAIAPNGVKPMAEGPLPNPVVNLMAEQFQFLCEAVKTARGCFAAAEIEGLSQVLAETTDERLKDLVERRILHADVVLSGTGLEPSHG